jgi:HK97 gp10 family phage protein
MTCCAALRAKARRDGVKGETFIVTVPKRARYPISKRTPTGVGVATVGKMLEYGTSKRQPMPWMRPAFHAKKGEATKVMAEELLKGIDKLERKLGAGR